MKMTPEEKAEKKIRALLDLPPCDCGKGLDCPEIVLNVSGHPNEEAALAEMLAQNG